MPPESKTKIRPQQSCLKCRERKVKCDRSIPCHACIIRGIEAECTYLTTPEDREHISQAEIIDRLRREVAQLRTQLSQGPKPKKLKSRASSADRNARAAPYARPYAPAQPNILGEVAETNWSASSPESTGTLTHSARTVNSPDSTGSVGGNGSAQSHALSGSTGPFGTQIAEVDVATSLSSAQAFSSIGANFMDDATLSHCQGGIPAFAPADIPTTIPMHGLQSQVDPAGIPSVYHDENTQYTSDRNNTQYLPIDPTQAYLQGVPNGDMAGYGNGKAHAYPQNHWGHAPDLAPAHPYTDSYYSSIQAFAHTNADPHAMVHPQGHTQSPPAPCPSQDVPTQLAGLNIPSSWKGDGKQALLETLLETIGSCDESQVAQVVQVVRTSATPEEAVSGICQVLGISAGATTAGQDSH